MTPTLKNISGITVVLLGSLGRVAAAERMQAGSLLSDLAITPLVGGDRDTADERVGEMLADEMLRKVSFSMGSSLFYDSNVRQSPGTADNPVQSDLMLMVLPGVQMSRSATNWDVSLDFSGTYGHGLFDSNYSPRGLDSDLSAAYRLGRIELGCDLMHSFDESSNRFYGGVVRELSYGFGLSASYELSPKTSVESSYNSSWSKPESGFGSTESHSCGLSAMWRFSPLLRVGPGLGYQSNSGDTQQSRETVGPTLSAEYKLSQKVSVSGSLGWDFMIGEGASSGGDLSGQIDASYSISPLSKIRIELSRGIQSDGALEGGYREGTEFRILLEQKIGQRLTAGLGLGFENSSFLGVASGSSRPDVDFLTTDFSVSMPVLGNRASSSVFVRYSQSASNDQVQDWSSMQTGISLNFRF